MYTLSFNHHKYGHVDSKVMKFENELLGPPFCIITNIGQKVSLHLKQVKLVVTLSQKLQSHATTTHGRCQNH